MTYPHTPGFARHSDTSREAAESLTSKDILVGTIMRALDISQRHGLTVDEAKQECEIDHRRSYDRSTIAARFTEMEAEGRIMKTKLTRKTPRNRRASVYVATQHFQESLRFDPPKTAAERKTEAAQKLVDLLAQHCDAVMMDPLEKTLINNLAKEAGLSCHIK